MYENYTRQALPSKYYRELLGTSLCVFNSNTAFIIENILRFSRQSEYNWYALIDCTSGQLAIPIKNTIAQSSPEIAELFEELAAKRNRIVHSFQITDMDGAQRLATKTKVKDGNEQFVVTENYLLDFIKQNERLAGELHNLRGY